MSQNKYRADIFLRTWTITTELEFDNRTVCGGPLPYDVSAGYVLRDLLEKAQKAQSDQEVCEIMKEWIAK